MQTRRRRAVLAVLLALLGGLTAVATAATGGAGTVDGRAEGAGPIGPGATLQLAVAGRGGVPATGAAAVALNITAVGASQRTFLTVHPGGSGRPAASNLNVDGGRTVANLAIVALGADGSVSISNDRGAVDVVVDVLGWFPASSSFTALRPARLIDSRKDGRTVDDGAIGFGPMPARSTVTFPALGRGGVPASGVGAVALNVTAVDATGASFVTAYPAGARRPDTSNLNVTGGETAANLVLVPVGGDGNVSLHNALGTVELVVDVLGWFPPGGAFNGVAAARLADTRGLPTVDGAGSAPRLVSGAVLRVPVLGRAGVPTSGVGAVAVNVTAIGASAPAAITVWPAGTARPEASNVNVDALATRANLALVPVGADGAIDVAAAGADTDVAVDVLGWFPAGAGTFQGLLPARLLDTRAA